jgi:hypothetical protein
MFVLLQRLAPAWLFDWAWRWFIRRMLRARQEVTCKLCTVSDIMAAHHLRSKLQRQLEPTYLAS